MSSDKNLGRTRESREKTIFMVYKSRGC